MHLHVIQLQLTCAANIELYLHLTMILWRVLTINYASYQPFTFTYMLIMWPFHGQCRLTMKE